MGLKGGLIDRQARQRPPRQSSLRTAHASAPTTISTAFPLFQRQTDWVETRSGGWRGASRTYIPEDWPKRPAAGGSESRSTKTGMREKAAVTGRSGHAIHIRLSEARFLVLAMDRVQSPPCRTGPWREAHRRRPSATSASTAAVRRHEGAVVTALTAGRELHLCPQTRNWRSKGNWAGGKVTRRG
jgi:hypothetical protein